MLASTRLRVATAAALLALLALTGCGSASSDGGIANKTPAEIVAASHSAADAAGSVHVAGSIANQGSPISLDLSLLAGKGAEGHVFQNGVGFEVIRIGATIYINGSEAFYRRLAGPSAARLLAGKWVKTPAGGAGFDSLQALTDLQTLIDTTFSGHAAGDLSKGAITAVGGQRAVPVTDRVKGGTIYVATTGLPYPLALSGSATRAGRVAFDRWNGPVTLTAPAGAVDLSQLQRGQ